MQDLATGARVVKTLQPIYTESAPGPAMSDPDDASNSTQAIRANVTALFQPQSSSSSRCVSRKAQIIQAVIVAVITAAATAAMTMIIRLCCLKTSQRILQTQQDRQMAKRNGKPNDVCNACAKVANTAHSYAALRLFTKAQQYLAANLPKSGSSKVSSLQPHRRKRLGDLPSLESIDAQMLHSLAPSTESGVPNIHCPFSGVGEVAQQVLQPVHKVIEPGTCIQDSRCAQQVTIKPFNALVKSGMFHSMPLRTNYSGRSFSMFTVFHQ